jgi:hypothetical protein
MRRTEVIFGGKIKRKPDIIPAFFNYMPTGSLIGIIISRPDVALPD